MTSLVSAPITLLSLSVEKIKWPHPKFHKWKHSGAVPYHAGSQQQLVNRWQVGQEQRSSTSNIAYSLRHNIDLNGLEKRNCLLVM